MGIPCGRSEGRTREAYNVMACQDGILYIENEGGDGTLSRRRRGK